VIQSAEPLKAPACRFGLGSTNCRAAREVVEGIQRAESMGAEIAFVAEDIYCRDTFALCALAANDTHTIRLATGVVNPYTRAPTSLAMGIATLDEISAGRAVLGLGAGSPTLIEQQMGIPHGSSLTVMREATEIIRSLLSGETVTYEGSRFHYRQAALGFRPVQQRIPIYFAAMGPKMLQLAGRLADGVLLNVGASIEFVRWAIGHVRAGSRQAGRPDNAVTIAAWLTAYVSGEREVGLRRAREWLATILSIPRQGELLLEHGGFDGAILSNIRRHVTGYPHGGDPAAAARYVPTEFAEQMTLVGTVEQVNERLRAYRDAGIDLPVLGLGALTQLFGN
jgi:5,10-methylenetetrahydromethanopterin reductase